MPTDLVRKIDLGLLYPGFYPHALELLARCAARGARYEAYFGYRSVAEQDALYAQGRTAPGNKVTNAPGGLSAHNWGLAMDVKLAGPDPWAPAGYDILAEEGASMAAVQVGVPGLKDLGHIQLPLNRVTGRHEVDLFHELKATFDGGGMPAAWAMLDQWGFST